MFFFDSWGSLHVTCSPSHPHAAAFGPTGISREADPMEAGLMVLAGETPHTAARQCGRLIEGEEGGWDTLAS